MLYYRVGNEAFLTGITGIFVIINAGARFRVASVMLLRCLLWVSGSLGVLIAWNLGGMEIACVFDILMAALISVGA